ncbi:alkaline phosphatase family protein [Occallatibacter riparius]|uniref:alkaline phosphatase family protein n=1 Tax=Occallatibacter riparius TaxID=1002689 RepID=UPI0028C46B2D|nr:alkaline phosphatase family protein [Occallatibacter riparius]
MTLTANTTVTASFTAVPPPTYQLTVQDAGSGSGTITSAPSGINCGSTCTATFNSGTAVTLTASAGTGSSFGGWTGACSGSGNCTVTIDADTTVGATFNISSNSNGIDVINHIVLVTQENRSLDNYLGALRQYWRDNGYADISFDGLAQFNPTTGEAPLEGPAPSVPGCNPNNPPPADCSFDPTHPITSFHLKTMCTENTSPSWNEAHVDWSYEDQVGRYPATNDGFGWVTGHDSRAEGFYDTDGIRVMGYYDAGDLNFLYFMASNFSTSDRWFHPVMSRTNINREYMIAATSQGYAYPNGTNSRDQALLTAKTIYQELTDAGVSWKIYVNPQNSKCSQPYQASCLMTLSYLQNFSYSQTVISQYPQNIAPISQYYTDLQNNTLPQVVVLEPASMDGDDEHGSDSDSMPTNIQRGEAYAESLINALMTSSAWNSSALFMTYDENGGLYDHVPPQPAVSPDGIKPVDLQPGDVCTKVSGPTCDFTYTGYRVPLVVISPFAKKHYVSHTVADYTAMLKFIETRFNLAPLTKRDAAQMDMTEFFDFNNPSWMTPPTPPAQKTNGACYLDHLP